MTKNIIEMHKNFIPKEVSNKKFGFFFSIIFLCVNFYYLFIFSTFNIFLTLIFIYFLFSTLFFNNLLLGPKKVWFQFGYYLNKITSPLILLLLYISIFIPIGFLLKLFNKELIEMKFKSKKSTYWKNVDRNIQSMTKQY